MSGSGDKKDSGSSAKYSPSRWRDETLFEKPERQSDTKPPSPPKKKRIYEMSPLDVIRGKFLAPTHR